jgi:hypothetical protein
MLLIKFQRLNTFTIYILIIEIVIVNSLTRRHIIEHIDIVQQQQQAKKAKPAKQELDIVTQISPNKRHRVYHHVPTCITSMARWISSSLPASSPIRLRQTFYNTCKKHVKDM